MAIIGGYKRWLQYIATIDGYSWWLQLVATVGGYSRWQYEDDDFQNLDLLDSVNPTQS